MNGVITVITSVTPVVHSYGPTMAFKSFYKEIGDPDMVELIVLLMRGHQPRNVRVIVDRPEVISGEYCYDLVVKESQDFINATIELIPWIGGKEPTDGGKTFVAT